MNKKFHAAIVLVTGLVTAVGASAQSAGALLGRVGATQIKPQVSSGDLTAPSLPGTQADIKANTQLTGGVTYMVTDQFSLDLPLALGFKHDIVGAGAIGGVGKIGEVKALPVTLLGQYRLFGAGDALRPYVGVGPTYAKFYKARSTAVLTALTGGTPASPTTLTVQSKWTYSLQLGLSYALAPGWMLDAAVLKTPLKTRTTLSTGQTLDAKLDPTSVTVGVGYKF